MKTYKELFDFIDCLKNLKYFNDANNLAHLHTLRAYKRFVGLKFKMYTFITEGNNQSAKAKGINENVIYDELKYEDHKNVLLIKSSMRHEINRIQSKDHIIGLYKINESTLASSVDKKYILNDGKSRLSHFHKSHC